MANVLTVGVLIVAFCDMGALGEPGSSVPSFYDDFIKICLVSEHLDFLDDLLAPRIDIQMNALNTTPSEKCLNTYKNNNEWSDTKVCMDLLSFFQVCELQKPATSLETTMAYATSTSTGGTTSSEIAPVLSTEALESESEEVEAEEETSTPSGDSHFEKDCEKAKSVIFLWTSIGFLFMALTLVLAVVAFWVYNTYPKCADLAKAMTPDTIQAGTEGAGLESVL